MSNALSQGYIRELLKLSAVGSLPVSKIVKTTATKIGIPKPPKLNVKTPKLGPVTTTVHPSSGVPVLNEDFLALKRRPVTVSAASSL